MDDEVSEVRKKLAKSKIRPFQYSHQGSLAYIGSEKAIADLPFMNGNVRCSRKSIESERADRIMPPIDCDRRCCYVLILEKCIFEHSFFLEEPYLCGYRLAEG